MIPAKEPSNEPARLEALYQCNILDTEPESGFDEVTKLAAYICQTPIAMVSMIDKDRQWFKSKVGIKETETSRKSSFCAHAILQDGIFIVRDTLQDERFVDNPLVTDEPYIRFYAGVPIKTTEGYPIGTLCVIDHQPKDLNQDQINNLKALSKQVAYIVSSRRSLADINHSTLFASSKPDSPKRKFIRQIALWTGIAASMVISVGAIAFVNLKNVEISNQSLIMERDSADKINRAFSHLKDLKAELSNYILSESPNSLEKYEILVTKLELDLATLREIPTKSLLEKSLSQSSQLSISSDQNVVLLIEKINKDINDSRQVLQIHQSSGLEASRQKIKNLNLENSLDTITSQIEEMIKAGDISLLQQRQSIQSSASRSVQLSLFTLISTLGVLGLLFYLVNHEVDTRRRLTTSLEQERDFTVAILDNVDALVIVLDLNGNVIRFNRECELVTGYHYEEVRNQNFYKIFLSPEDQAVVSQDLGTSTSAEIPRSYENYWKVKDGEKRLISWSTTLLKNIDGKASLVIATGLDITERKQAEEEVSLQNWRSLVFSKITLRIRQSLNIDEILNTTVDEIRQFLNCDRVVIYQYINEDWEGKVVVESVGEEWIPCLETDIKDVCFREGLWESYRQGRKVVHDDVINSSMPQCYKDLMAQYQVRANLVVPILESDYLWGLLIAHQCSDSRHWRKFEVDFVSEISDQVGIALYQATLLKQEIQRRRQLSQQNLELEKARYQAETATKMKSSFLATMSHEIRTPMNAVLGMTGLLADTQLSSLQRDFVETVRISGENLLTLINEILDFSKLEANEMELEEIDFDLNTSVEEVTDLLAMLAQTKGLELASLIHRDVPLYLIGDVARLRQILTNLVSNSIKFTATGEVIIKVSLLEETETSAKIHFRVIDTGIGISPAAQKKLFNPFTQVDASTTRKYGGTGLGLAICKQIVDLMGGSIGIDSEEGKGSQFWFTIPFAKQTAEAIAKIKPTREVELQNVRVLVIDDSQTNCKILTYQISAWQMRVDAIQSPSDAIQILKAAIAEGDPYQIAILDMQMPDLDGEMLGSQIKADPIVQDTKLIMLTSLNQQGGISRFKELGFEFYLVKPVKQSKLMDVLMAVMATEIIPDTPRYVHLNTTKLNDQSCLLTSSNSQIQKHSKMKILIAEDSLINQKVALHQLRSFGYDADVAGNGKEALKLMEFIDYDIILMDCQMPELDGYETTMEIRKLNSPKSKVVIVAMTANAMKEDRDRCLAVGMDDYLSKPIRKESLEQKLAKWEAQIFAPASKEETHEVEITTTTEASLSNDVKSSEQLVENYDSDYQVPLIDWEHVNEVVDNNEEFKAELLEMFCDSIPPVLIQLEEAIAELDFIKIRGTAHFIKGSTANIGVRAMMAISDDLEKLSVSYGKAILGNIAEVDAEKIEETKKSMNIYSQKLQSSFSKVRSLIDHENSR
ncbi:response regulator [Pseudanabaena biceps]|nr:response regulator [Pseudanabaena biceps]